MSITPANFCSNIKYYCKKLKNLKVLQKIPKSNVHTKFFFIFRMEEMTKEFL